MDYGEPHVGDCIEALLKVGFQDVYNWNFPMKSKESGKNFLQIKDEFSYFCGEVLEKNFLSYGEKSPLPFRGRIGAELVLDCGLQIKIHGLIEESEKAKADSEEFLEGLGTLWGDISFTGGELSWTPITGTITSIRDLSIPLSTGKFVLRLITLDTSQRKTLKRRIFLFQQNP